MNKRSTIQSNFYKSALHARQHAHHLTQIHVAHLASLCTALQMEFLYSTTGDNGHTCFKRGHINENVFSHFAQLQVVRK